MPAELVAVIVTNDVADDVGVPLITPVPVLTVRPTGKEIALKLVGPLEAVMVAEQGTVVPGTVIALVMTGATTAADTVNVSVAEPVPPEFEALT